MLTFLILITIIVAGVIVNNWMVIATGGAGMIFACLISISIELTKTRKALEQIEKYFESKYLRGD